MAQLPAGPDSPPMLQALRWMRSPFRMLEECRERYGDAFSLDMPGMTGRVVVVSHPDMVKDVFALSSEEGHVHKANKVLEPFLGQHSLLLLDGAEHLRQRKMMLPAFHGERMHAYGRAMLDLARASVERWPRRKAFAVHRPMQAITLQVIIRTVFGVEAGPQFTELSHVLTRGLDIGAWPVLLFPIMQRDLGRFSPWGRYLHYATRASDILRAEIRRGRREGTKGRDDVLSMMLDAKDEDGEPLTEDEVHDELVTLLIAGHETTATALAWALRWLLLDRELIGRLRDEIATANEDPARIAKLELLDATVKESLRLQPVIPMVGRELQQPTSIGRIELPRGALVAPAIYLVHRRPELYPEPDRFRPDRFLELKPSPWEWLPFGGGLRRCIGAAFAMYEMKMVLATVLPRLDLRLASERVRTVRRGITITPGRGLPVIAA